jgi:hypothetical protein
MPQVKKGQRMKGQPSCEGKQIMELDEAVGIIYREYKPVEPLELSVELHWRHAHLLGQPPTFQHSQLYLSKELREGKTKQ